MGSLDYLQCTKLYFTRNTLWVGIKNIVFKNILAHSICTLESSHVFPYFERICVGIEVYS